MSKNSKILIVTLLVLALIAGAVLFSQPELFKGMLRFSKSIEKQSVPPGTWQELKPDEPTKKGFGTKPDGPEEKKSITVPDLIL